MAPDGFWTYVLFALLAVIAFGSYGVCWFLERRRLNAEASRLALGASKPGLTCDTPQSDDQPKKRLALAWGLSVVIVLFLGQAVGVGRFVLDSKNREIATVKNGLEKKTKEAAQIERELLLVADALDRAKLQLASLQRDNEKLRMDVADVNAKHKADLVTLKTLNDEIIKYRLLAEHNHHRAAIVILWLSRVRNHDVLVHEKAMAMLLSHESKETPGAWYAKALGHDISQEWDRYVSALARVPKNDPWYDLAAAESVAAKKDPRALVGWLVEKLEASIRSTDDPARLGLLLVQRAVGQQAVVRLTNKGYPTVKALIAVIDAAEDGGQRAAAVAALGQIGSAAKEAMPRLVRILREDDAGPDVRWQAAYALGRMGSATREAVNALVDTTKIEADPAVRAAASSSLALVGWNTDELSLSAGTVQGHVRTVDSKLETIIVAAPFGKKEEVSVSKGTKFTINGEPFPDGLRGLREGSEVVVTYRRVAQEIKLTKDDPYLKDLHSKELRGVIAIVDTKASHIIVISGERKSEPIRITKDTKFIAEDGKELEGGFLSLKERAEVTVRVTSADRLVAQEVKLGKPKEK